MEYKFKGNSVDNLQAVTKLKNIFCRKHVMMDLNNDVKPFSS